jgi:hypothetical protein
MIAADRLHRCQPAKLEQGFPARRTTDVTGVEDQVDAAEELRDARRQPLEELRTVGVGDDADANGLQDEHNLRLSESWFRISKGALTEWQ